MDVVYTPQLRRSLVSVSKLTSDGVTILFGKDQATAYTKEGTVLFYAVRIGGLFYIADDKTGLDKLRAIRKKENKGGNVMYESHLAALKTDNKKRTKLYTLGFRKSIHERFGHISYSMIDKHWPCILGGENIFCEACAACKLRRKPFPKASLRVVERPGQELHHDWVPESRRGKLNEIGTEFIIDKWSKKIWVIPLATAKKVAEAFLEVKRRVETKFGRPVEIVQGDSHSTNVGIVIGGECKKTGTRPQFSTPHEKQQNGFTERNIQIWKLQKDHH